MALGGIVLSHPPRVKRQVSLEQLVFPTLAR